MNAIQFRVCYPLPPLHPPFFVWVFRVAQDSSALSLLNTSLRSYRKQRDLQWPWMFGVSVHLELFLSTHFMVRSVKTHPFGKPQNLNRKIFDVIDNSIQPCVNKLFARMGHWPQVLWRTGHPQLLRLFPTTGLLSSLLCLLYLFFCWVFFFFWYL